MTAAAKARVAVVGFGRLGRACAQALHGHERLTLAGVVRRGGAALPAPFQAVACVDHISGLGQVDAVLVCVPPEATLGVVTELLQRRLAVVECAELHGAAFTEHRQQLAQVAHVRKGTVIVGAGWDPGLLSLLRAALALAVPKGHTAVHHAPGISLHHTTLAHAVPGVRQALVLEARAADGTPQRYVYVELASGADLAGVERAIRGDPLFLDVETQVFAVDDVAQLEEEGRGVVVERQGSAAGVAHQALLLEGRFAVEALAAEVMLVAALALPQCQHGAYSLFDLPFAALWGELRERWEQEWI